MPDDDRKRRRLGDATKSRIAELADGWTVEPADDAEDEDASEAPLRPKPRTQPPPPPGASERMALDDILIIEAGDTPPPAPRPKPPSVPPPIPPPRKPTQQVHALNAKSGPADVQNASASGVIEEPQRPSQGVIDPTKSIMVTDLADRSPAPIFDPAKIKAGPSRPGIPKLDLGSSASRPVFPLPAEPSPPQQRPPSPPPPRMRSPSPPPQRPPTTNELTIPELGPPSDARLAVPVGEFDTSAATTIEEGKMRIAHQQATIVRDATNALLNIAESTSMRGDVTTVDGSTGRFERGDPTTTDAGKKDPRDVSTVGMTQSMGTLRSAAALRRKRGLGGDVRYVVTAIMGVRESRRELADLEARQTTRQASRRHHLLTLGRTAVVVETYDHPALTRARELLHGIEDDRGRNAGLVTAADLELDRVRRDRDAAAKQYITDAASTDAELAELAKKLEPLEKEATAVRKRVSELQESLKRIEKKIASTEASLDSPKQKQDRAAIQADIATLKADRVAVKRDEPVIAEELDALAPRIAAIEAKRTDAQRRRRELDKAELDDQRRSEELMAAIGAKRKVVDRAAAEAEAERDKILFELGDRLYVDRPRNLKAQLAPIEDIDLELGTGDRRIMELRELIASVDKAKLARGIAVIVLVATAAIALVTIVLMNVL